MRSTQQRAIRFLHPDFDAPTVPGLVVSETGRLALAEGSAAVRQSLLLLLSTSPGERVMRPEYGCELRRLIFSPNDNTTAGLARHYVQQAISRWEPRVRIRSLAAGPDPDHPARLLIFLDYLIVAARAVDSLAFALNLTGDSD